MRRYATMVLLLLSALLFSAWAASSAWATVSPGAAAWGGNSGGQLGNGSASNSLDPTPIGGLSEVTQIAAGKDHALALLSSGKVMAWGENSSGQLGNGTTTSSNVPVEVKGLSEPVTAIAAGDEFSLALLANGTVVAWGLNAEGQLGDGSINASDTPQLVHELGAVKAIAAGAKHGLALLEDGEVKAWGSGSSGQLGDGSTEHGEIAPVLVHELSGVQSIAAGGLSSYAVLSGGGVDAWGANGRGQLGNGTKTSSDLPVAVKTLMGATQVAAGETHALALMSSGSVYAWGDGTDGELGNGFEATTDEPVQVLGLVEATAVAAGTNFSLALLGSHVVTAWGANHEGQLGDGSTEGSAVPVTLTAIDEVQGIAAGGIAGYALGPELPTATSLNPAFGPAGGSTEVTIKGTGFNGVKSVHFGPNEASAFTRTSETEITATAPAGTGVVNVTVTIAGGTSPAATANRYSYAPIVTGISPGTGPQAGGTEVVISGMNLGGASAVKFGANNAASFKVESGSEVIAFSPAGVGDVSVTVTGPGGTSESVPGDEFKYESTAPELGRCVKTKKHRIGGYSDRGCTVVSGEGHFEWKPGASDRPAFKIRSEAISLQVPTGQDVVCLRGKGSGQYSGAKSLTHVVLDLRQCGLGKEFKCKSPSAAKEGEIISQELDGLLGIIQLVEPPTENEIGLDLSAVGGAPLFEFTCAGITHVWRGSVIVPIKANAMEKVVMLNFKASNGHQEVEAFEGQPRDILESSVGGGAYEQSALVGILELKAKEIEINSVH